MRAFAIVLALLAATGAVRAAEINAFISTAIKAATDELLPPFERANGHTIRASYAPSGALIPRFERGEPVDVFLTDAPAIDTLIQQGKIVGGRTDLARTGIGICVRKGAPKPDVSTPDALKRALLAAKTHVNVFLYDGAIVPDPDGIITAGHDNATARTVAIGQGERIDERALTALFRAVIANNRAGGWRTIQREG